jgi:hypothetical protein
MRTVPTSLARAVHAIPTPVALRSGRLTHLDPYSYPFDVVDPAARDPFPWFVTDDAPSCYRYVLADPRTRTRAVGLVTAWVGGPAPSVLILEEFAIEEVASDQGRPLGNVRDCWGVVHRLEAYEGAARQHLLLDLARSALASATSVPLPWMPTEPAAAQPVWLVSRPTWESLRGAAVPHEVGESPVLPAPWMLHRIDPSDD